MSKRIKKLTEDDLHLLVDHWRLRAVRAEAQLFEMRAALQGVLSVADRDTNEFARARKAVAMSAEGTMQ